MSNTLIKVFQREPGKYGYDPVGTLTYADPLVPGTTTLNDGGEVYVLQPFTTGLGDSCELVTINNGATTLEAQPQLTNATDLLQVRITQLTQVESQPTVVAPLDAETLSHLLSRDLSRSVVDTQVVTTDTPKALDEAGTAALWVPTDVKESETNFAEVGLVPVMVGDNLYYINTTQAIDNNEPVVTQIIPELPQNSERDMPLDKGSTVLSFVVDNPDQLGSMLPLSNLQQAPIVTSEVPNIVAEAALPLLSQAKPVVKLKSQEIAKVGRSLNKHKNGRSLLKGSVTVKQARPTPAQTNLCLNKVNKGNKTLVLPPILHKNLSSSHEVYHPKIQMVKNADNDSQQSNQQQSLAVVAISSDKAKDLTEIVVNTSKGKQVFKGKTSDLINAMSALWCANNGDSASTENQGEKTEQNNESSEAEDEDDDECDDQPVADALEQLGTSLDSLLNDEDHSWRCPEQDCNRVFQRLHVLKVHILSHYGVRPYKCDYPRCKWAFFTHFRLKRHRETHLKKKDFKCPNPNCDRSFTTIYNLKTHQKLHQRPAVIECPVPQCSSRFQTKRHLEVHMREHGSDHAPFACPVSSCDKRYYSLNSVNSHVRSHQHKENDLRCQWAGCKKIFDKPCRLQAHMRTHTGDKPYRCNYQGCTWAFTSSSKLKRHQQKHTNTRNFACHVEGCGKLFMRPEHLREHVLTHSPERPFRCTHNNCGLRFTAKSSLYVHMKKHRAQSDASADASVTGTSTVMSNAIVAAQGSNTPAISAANDVTIAPAQSSETRIVYYCPVEDCETSVCSMADIRSHILDVHSPLLTQGDLMQLVSGLHPVSFAVESFAQEPNSQTSENDGMVSAVQLSGSDVMNTSGSSVLNELPEFLTQPHLAQQHTADPLLLDGQSTQEAPSERGLHLLGTHEIQSTQPSSATPEAKSLEEESTGCARTISYQTWRQNHPRSNSEMRRSDEALSSMHPVSCVADVPGLSELRIPSDVVLGGALLGTTHDNIAQFLLSEDLGSGALYDSEEGMLSMDSPFEPSTINLRDLE